MNLILLSGGSGRRLWPLSNDARSKQFIKLFKDDAGNMESMIQRVYRQIKSADRGGSITVTTSKEQMASIRNQLGEDVRICMEPGRRDTFPAIVLAASYLCDVEKLTLDEPVIVCPVDPFVREEYFEALKKLAALVAAEETELTLMGIEPTYASEKYGYIIPVSGADVCRVKTFKEKPDAKTAEKYIEQGALWNSGVFAFRLGWLLEKAHGMIDFLGYHDLYDKYDGLDKLSFDYAVVEKTENIQVMRFSGEWKDIGTWNTLAEVVGEPCIGNGILGSGCENTDIINELDVPILCMGLKDTVVAASPQGILVSDKESSSFMKPYVERIDQQVMFAEKSWGSFRILDAREDSVTIKVILKPGRHMNYHSHARRDEVWTVISGEGKTIIDGIEQDISVGDVITVQARVRHTVMAKTDLELIEVQLGREISIHDKKIYDFEF